MSGFFDDPDYPEEESDAPRAPLFWRIVGKTVKIVFWSLIILVNGLLFWRMFSSGMPSSMKTVEADEALRRSYSAYLSDTGEEKPPFAVYQKENQRKNITDEAADKETGFPGNYGYFSLESEILFPSAHRAQVVFRYNRSTLDALKRDYGLEFDPDPGSDWYDVSLRVVYADGGREVRVPSVSVLSETKSRYCYRKLIFRDLPDMDGVSDIYVDIYYSDDADYSARPYGTLRIWSDQYQDREYKLSKKDIAALTGE